MTIFHKKHMKLRKEYDEHESVKRSFDTINIVYLPKVAHV